MRLLAEKTHPRSTPPPFLTPEEHKVAHPIHSYPRPSPIVHPILSFDQRNVPDVAPRRKSGRLAAPLRAASPTALHLAPQRDGRHLARSQIANERISNLLAGVSFFFPLVCVRGSASLRRRPASHEATSRIFTCDAYNIQHAICSVGLGQKSNLGRGWGRPKSMILG